MALPSLHDMRHVNMNARALSALLFSVVYRFSYSALLILCIFLLAVTPADHIYQTVSNHRIGNVFVVGGTVVVTFLLAVFLYLSRLYTNRTTLASIPRPYIPVEAGEVSDKVHNVITKNRLRSAILAWDSRPRDVREELAQQEQDVDEATPALRSELKRTIFPVDADTPPWGHISHPGWSDPTNLDIPYIQFESVISEIPHLVEAKAVSLAPPDPAFVHTRPSKTISTIDGIPPDARVVTLLQRPPTMGLRDYVSHLEAFGLVDPPEVAENFLAKYEYARFSGFPLTEDEFRRLMDAFSDLLMGMVRLDVVALEEALSQTASKASSMLSAAPSLQSSTGSVYRPRAAASVASSRSSIRSVIRQGAG